MSREELLAERRGYAAVILAAGPDVCEALLTGLAVPRDRLHAGTLAALGEPSNGPDVVLDDELALRVEVVRAPSAADQPAPGRSDAFRIEDAETFATVDEPGADPLVSAEGGASTKRRPAEAGGCMSRRSAPLVPPFPHVSQTRKQKYALEQAIRRLKLVNWPREVTPGSRRVSSYAQRDVLVAIAGHVDGAGRAILSIATIVRESGYAERTVWRAIGALEDQDHLKRIGTTRSADRYPTDLPPQARRGQGANVYRVGAALRAAADLVERDWTPAKSVKSESENGAVAPPETEDLDVRGTPHDELVAPPVAHPADTKPRGTPIREVVADADMQGDQPVATLARGTPITNNATASEEVRLVLSRGEGTLEHSCSPAPRRGCVLVGEEGFVAFVRPAYSRGLITHGELLERLEIHGLVMRRTLPVDEDETSAAVELAGGGVE